MRDGSFHFLTDMVRDTNVGRFISNMNFVDYVEQMCPLWCFVQNMPYFFVKMITVLFSLEILSAF